MDVGAVLGWLALAVVLNTCVTALLTVLAVRSSLGASRADPGRRAIASTGVPRGSSFDRPGTGTATEGADPLAGAISAFLDRSDGLFRAGGPPSSRSAPRHGPARQAVGPGPRPRAALPASPAALAPPAPPGHRSPAVPGLDRHLSEVTWATARPTRFVPSGPAAPDTRAPTVDGADPTGAAVPSTGSTDPVPTGYSATSDVPAIAPVRRSVSRVSIALSNRDGSGAAAGPATVARLGPVIGGLIRERTRVGDRVTGLTGGRWSLVLPDTSMDGAAALTRRLAQSCDAWLAAEQPPLRLEFGWVELPADAATEGAVTVRLSGPERRRTVPQHA